MLRSSLLVALCLALAGCGRTYEDSLRAPDTEGPNLTPRVGGATKKLVPVEAASLDGVLAGRVVFQGSVPPKREVAPADKPECRKALGEPKFKDDIYDNEWIVGEGQGVKNVVVFLKAPDGKFLPVGKDDETVVGEVVIDQPFCAFHPQVIVHYPVFNKKDGEREPTGQKLTIYNTGEILHNANLQGADSKYGSAGFNVAMPPKDKKAVKLNPQPSPLMLRCDVHPWMKANIWVFDHPYAAKTDESGNFTLNNVPTGVDLKICFWHPSVGFFGEGGETGKTIRFTPGKNSLPGPVPISPK